MSLTVKISDNLLLDIAKTNPSTAKQIAVAMTDGRAAPVVIRTRKLEGLDAGQVTLVAVRKSDEKPRRYFAFSPALNKLVEIPADKFQPLMP